MHDLLQNGSSRYKEEFVEILSLGKGGFGVFLRFVAPEHIPSDILLQTETEETLPQVLFCERSKCWHTSVTATWLDIMQLVGVCYNRYCRQCNA
ncbi:Eukaryotic translation initiation factor 2-alpha kinase [Desmophyllum pertusum]|uniref:Eukaryotic translation initiation factor 2-alpha kinase n=1 Tax=Desmophyllum pertusum TaxID=174260 RepID=A0A9X0D2W5_9CNID|nr:Eukaryotic translation initiation factor 2-alpha kinase [Desmophyllum pertusum]